MIVGGGTVHGRGDTVGRGRRGYGKGYRTLLATECVETRLEVIVEVVARARAAAASRRHTTGCKGVR